MVCKHVKNMINQTLHFVKGTCHESLKTLYLPPAYLQVRRSFNLVPALVSHAKIPSAYPRVILRKLFRPGHLKKKVCKPGTCPTNYF
jgi:hypothetical protein